MKALAKVNFKSNLEYLLLAFLFVSIPLKNGINTSAFILLTVYSLIKISDFEFLKLKQFYSFYSFFVLLVFSLSYTENLPLGIRYIEKYSIFLVVPFIFSTININKRKLFSLLLLFSVTIVILTLYCEYYVISNLIFNGDSFSALLNKRYSYLNFSTPVDIHPAYFSLFIIISILTFSQLILNYRSSAIIKCIGFVLIVFLMFVIVQLTNRTYLLALFIVLNYCIYFILLRVFKKTSALVLSMIGINVLLIFGFTQTGFAQKRIQQVFGYTYANGYKHEDGKKKLLQWSSAIGANKNVIFGNGMGDAKESILLEYEKRGYSYYFENNYNAHNQYLETYVGLGFLGLISLLFIMIHGMVRAIKSSIGVYRILYFILPIVFLTESYLERHHGLVFFVLAYTFIILSPEDQQA